ncbi:MAG: NAD(P)H-hydrate dehydratase [Lachnospiraceae bacterium]|nr:NAD(P)H-hydrate dehydratase [Lachnospiraceae bacterium]
MGIVTDKIMTPELIREAERLAMNVAGIPESVLIETAAGALAACVETMQPNGRIAVLAGSGNNGADAIAAARFLANNGFSVDVYETEVRRRSDGYLGQLEKLVASGLPIARKALTKDIPFGDYDIAIDGLFGIGLNRAITGEIAEIIDALNAVRESFGRPRIVSADVPSGIDALGGSILGTAVKADVTVTFSAKKTGLVLYPGREYAGKTIIADAGIPMEPVAAKGYNRLCEVPKLPKRSPAGHKGTFGRILILAGSETGPGAALLATCACYRSGAGLVKLVIPAVVLPEVLHTVPEAVFCDRGRFLADPKAEMKGISVALIGPGLGTDEEAQKLLEEALEAGREEGTVFVLDADALNILARKLTKEGATERFRELAEILPAHCILTPHMAELSRLLGIPVAEIAEKRLEIATDLCGATDLVPVIKDACTLVAGDGEVWLNETGNDGMGTAGSGDVLAGIAAALSMESVRGTMRLAECAAAAVAVHGTAGDLAALEIGRRSLTAGDLVRYLPKAFGAPEALGESSTL